MPKSSIFSFKKAEETKTEPKAKTESKPKVDPEPKHLKPDSESDVQRLAAAMNKTSEGMTARIEKLGAELKKLSEKQVEPVDMEAVAKAAREANQEVLKEASDAAKAATEAAQAAAKAAEEAQQASIREIASLRRQLDALMKQLARTPEENKRVAVQVAAVMAARDEMRVIDQNVDARSKAESWLGEFARQG